MAIRYYHEFRFQYDVLEDVSALVRRIVAANPGSFTGPGTNTYVVGRGRVAVIDPGPALGKHVDAILHSLRSEKIEYILLTHSHIDHWPAAPELRRATGAPIYAFGPAGHNSSDSSFADQGLQDGDTLTGEGWKLAAIHTPGHASDHLCYALAQERVLFSGDHVMGWSTSVISPPDGNMRDYMKSLEKLLVRDDAIYLPAHGAAIADPKTYVRSFIEHRQERRAAILQRLRAGEATIPQLVRAVYVDVSPSLYGVAARSVWAHMIELVESGQVECEGSPALDQRYRLPKATLVRS
ncbi:MAG: MBL fold metallo-hydrolase [Acidobacteria bacterium]|nr:MBL fold metallo-hydrolase [Acidobacteriota bacterium]